jgi:cell pole-organizing protein PopZ
MEDILDSIRRILNEDGPQEASLPVHALTTADEDVLVLDHSMAVGKTASMPDMSVEPRVTETVEPVSDPSVAVSPTEVGAAALVALAPDLMAPETAAAAASSVSGMIRTLAAERSTHVWAGGPTVEDLVRAEMRPLLKQWLDAHLPALVERLVHAEIERVVRRAVP